MLIAHAPLSYLGNELIQRERIKTLQSGEQLLIALFSLFFGILPDFDLFLLTLFRIPTFLHHEVITHTPIFYLIVWIILKLIYRTLHNLLNKKIQKVLNLNLLDILIDTFLIATLLHLLGDLLVTEVMVLFPLMPEQFVILKYILEPNRFSGYSFSPLFAIEILILSIFLGTIVRKYLKENKVLDIVSKSVFILSCIYIPLSILVNFRTYNSSYLYDKNGNINYDMDYDGTVDHNDLDIGNTGNGNILQPTSDNLFDATLDIVNSKKLVAPQGSLNYILGGLDSYRLISQAYYNLHLPIESTLGSYKQSKSDSQGYENEIDYLDTLREYLTEKELLIELNLSSTPNIPRGKILFLIDKENNIINAGISLEGNYIGIVLESDKYLQMHSYYSVIEYYGEKVNSIYIVTDN